MRLPLRTPVLNVLCQSVDHSKPVDHGFVISKVALESKVKLLGIGKETFDKIIKQAKEGYSVSKLLKVDITLTYQLEN